MIRQVGVVLCAAALLVSCGGRNKASTSSSASSSAATATSTATPLPSNAPSVPSVSAGADFSTPASATGCPAGWITDAGAPFCYQLPAGFSDFSSQSGYAYGWQWRTLVSVDEHDLIQVIGEPVQADLDTYTPAAALQLAEGMGLQTGTGGVVSSTKLTPATVNGARAFLQNATYLSGVVTRDYIVLRGHAVVHISCQHTASHPAEVRAACDDVLATIAIAFT